MPLTVWALLALALIGTGAVFLRAGRSRA